MTDGNRDGEFQQEAERLEAQRKARQERAIEQVLAAEERIRKRFPKPGQPVGAAVPAPPPATPAGWYPHPTMANTQAYWDGAAWTDHVAPAASARPASPTTTPARDDTVAAWLIAVLPLLALGVYYGAAPTLELQTVIAIGFIVAALVLAVRDSKQLKHIGLSTTPGYALFAGVFYLFHRTRVAKSTPAIPIVGLISVVFGIVALNTFAAIADFGSSEVEQEIEAWAIRNDLGQLGISCPEVVGRVGDEFRCSVFSGGRGILRSFVVTIESDDSITWQAG